MSSRMDRYENSELGGLSRTKRNQDIYNSTNMSELSRIKTNTNVSVISDAPKEINIEKMRPPFPSDCQSASVRICAYRDTYCP